jgi:hypothetical protein
MDVHFATSLTARFFHAQAYLSNTSRPAVSAAVSGTVSPVPQGTLYVRVVLDAPVFETSVGLSITPPDAFTLGFTPVTTLAPGVYTGTVQVQVFQDAGLTRPYRVTGGTLPYVLTVDPELVVTVKVDGVVQTETFSSSHYAVTSFNPIGYGTIYWRDGTSPAASWTLHPGQVVELQASIPVTWYGPDRTAASYASWFDPPTVTSTTISQTMPDPATHGVGGLAGSSFFAMPLGGGQYGAGFVFDLVP